MIDVYVRELNDAWFGLAYCGERVVATSFGFNKEGTLKSLLRNLPPNVDRQIVEKGSDFAEKTILAMEKAHVGIEDFKGLDLATEYLLGSLAKVLKAASSIPIGYVASYGSIARVANTEPKAVGKIMASNPLYPIVPCHRVVGAEFSLVGYGGRKSPKALKAKLARLMAECKGFKSAKEISVERATLTVHPAERVIEKARKQGLDLTGRQRTLTYYGPNQLP